MNKKPLVGVSGKGRSGKDTVADYLLDKGWSKKVSLAGSLKKVCSEYFNIKEPVFYDFSKKEEPLKSEIVLDTRVAKGIIEYAFGKEGCVYPKIKRTVVSTPRELLQFVGSNILRISREDCFIVMLKNQVSDLNGIVVPDIRFPNEAEFILENNGILIRVERSSIYTINSNHSSEVSLDDWKKWSYVIKNSRFGLEFLYEKIEDMLKFLEV